MRRQVVVTLKVEGVHAWPDCPLSEVEFLKHPHRHMFHIKAIKNVNHGDRDIEIIMLKRKIESHLETNYSGNFKSMSCEHIAEYLIDVFDLYACEVLEDGENGAVVYG